MATAAAASIATMTLTGGGDDGRRGLDRVFAGWGQHILASGTSQSAPAGLDIFARFQHNPPAPPAGPGKPPNPAPPPVFHREFFIFTATRRNSSLFGPPPAAAPVVEACPLLDVSPGVVQAAGLIPVNNVDGKGGDSCTGQHGSHGPLTPLQKGGATPTIVDLALGQDWTVDTFDSPGSNNPVVQANHFGGLPGQMIEFRYNIDFRVDLLVWTNQAGVSTATADPSNRLYSTVQTNTWNVRYQINFNPPLPAGSPAYAGPPAGAPGQPVGGVVPPVTLTMNKDASPTRRAKAVDGTNLETRFPSALSLFSVDARS